MCENAIDEILGEAGKKAVMKAALDRVIPWVANQTLFFALIIID